MFRFVTRILFCLSVILAAATAPGARLETAACTFASLMDDTVTHHSMRTVAPDATADPIRAHRGQRATLDPCKHGCTAIAILSPHVTVTQATELHSASPRPEDPHAPSRPPAPAERPPKTLV